MVGEEWRRGASSSSSSSSPPAVLLSSPELSNTEVYQPLTRARIGTTAHFCLVVVLESRAPIRSRGGLGPKNRDCLICHCVICDCLSCEGCFGRWPRPCTESRPTRSVRPIYESQGRNLVLTVLHVPYSLDSGMTRCCTGSPQRKTLELLA